MPIKDNSKSWLAESRGEMGKRLEKAAIYLENQIKVALSAKGPPRSSPGEPPHIDSGKLRQSITHTIDKEALVAQVGSSLLYFRYLEGGTNFMAARPVLEQVLEANQGALKQILKG